MWPELNDIILIYAVLTPTSVVYWHTTTLLLTDWLGTEEAMLLVGFASAVAFAYYHEELRNFAPTTSSRPVLMCYETAYDYAVNLSCVCYVLGCRTVYRILIWRHMMQPLAVSILSAIFLMWLRGLRNVLSLPVVVNNDNSVERYRPLSTLYFSTGIRPRTQHSRLLESGRQVGRTLCYTVVLIPRQRGGGKLGKFAANIVYPRHIPGTAEARNLTFCRLIKGCSRNENYTKLGHKRSGRSHVT